MIPTVAEARQRLETAALVFGDLIAAGLDPGWSECQELESAAIAFREAVRAEEPNA